MTVPVLADVAETVEKYRTSFEKRMNAELDEHGKAARDLRLNYLEVLNKLKVELGRAENLKGATFTEAEEIERFQKESTFWVSAGMKEIGECYFTVFIQIQR